MLFRSVHRRHVDVDRGGGDAARAVVDGVGEAVGADEADGGHGVFAGAVQQRAIKRSR